MQCYVHHEVAAVGVCKCCAKGLCHHCAIPITHGLACSEICKPVGEALSQLQLTSIRNTSIYKAQRVVQPIAALGMAALGASFLYSDKRSFAGWAIVAMGVLIGISLAVASRRKR